MNTWRIIFGIVLLLMLPFLMSCDTLGLGNSQQEKEQEYYRQQLEAYQKQQEAYRQQQEAYNQQLEEGLKQWSAAYDQWLQRKQQEQQQLIEAAERAAEKEAVNQN